MSSPPYAAAYLRPWRQFVNPSSFFSPISISESTYRLTQNLNFFLPNYAYLIFFIFLLILFTHYPTSFLFFVIYTAWERLIFIHDVDEPFSLFDYNIDRKIILGFLYLITLIAIFWTHVWFKIFLALIVGLPIVFFHAILRTPEDSLEDLPNGSLEDLPNVVDGPRGGYSTF